MRYKKAFDVVFKLVNIVCASEKEVKEMESHRRQVQENKLLEYQRRLHLVISSVNRCALDATLVARLNSCTREKVIAMKLFVEETAKSHGTSVRNSLKSRCL